MVFVIYHALSSRCLQADCMIIFISSFPGIKVKLTSLYLPGLSLSLFWALYFPFFPFSNLLGPHPTLRDSLSLGPVLVMSHNKPKASCCSDWRHHEIAIGFSEAGCCPKCTRTLGIMRGWLTWVGALIMETLYPYWNVPPIPIAHTVRKRVQLGS